MNLKSCIRFRRNCTICGIKGNQCSEALKLTDFALNEAKKLGRNRCYIFNGETYRKFLRKREIIQELREAVINGFQGFTAFTSLYLRKIKKCLMEQKL